jgi:uncharacterized protein
MIFGMNDHHSRQVSSYKPRWLADRLRKAAKAHPVIVLTGPRQVGKTTLLRSEDPFSDWRYHSLDDLDVLRQAQREPEALWAGTDRIILDEAQRAPDMLLSIKQAVDQDRARRFVLSGSVTLDLQASVSETLAGRAVSFALAPMTSAEWEGVAPAFQVEALFSGILPQEHELLQAPETEVSITRGFLPALLPYSDRGDVLDWWSGYVTTYLERDLRSLSQVSSLPDFRRVMELASLRTGQLVNQTEMSRDSGVSQPTVHRYLNLLEASFLIHRMPAFSRNRGTRLIKAPKLYWTDAALPAFLAGNYDHATLRRSREAGGLFENLVVQQLGVAVSLLQPVGRVHHWRTAGGVEVDFVVEWGRSLVALECKFSDRPRYRDVKSLQRFLEEYPECACGVLVHAGREIKQLGDRIVAVPWTEI